MTDVTPAEIERRVTSAVQDVLHLNATTGDLEPVLEEALRHAAIYGNGYLRVRFVPADNPIEPREGLKLATPSGAWIFDAPIPTQIVEVVTVVAAGDPETTNSPDTTQETP